jgi:type II secretory pathway component GspD/PulD (secretin)
MLARGFLLSGLLVTCLCLWQQPALAGQGELITVTYPVGDVVIPINVEGTCSTRSPVTNSLSTSFEANLVHAITTTIAPQTWASAGGQGTIEYRPAGRALVVVQTQDNQEHIADLLAVLRRLNALQVVLEVRMLKVPESFFARLGSEFDIHCDIQVPAAGSSAGQGKSEEGQVQTVRPAASSCENLAFMTRDQDVRLTRAIQMDRRCEFLAMPKITVLNGQAASLNFADTKHFLTRPITEDGHVFKVPQQKPFEIGLKMNARPVVSADRRFVRVALDITKTDLAADVPPVPVQFLIPPAGKNSSPGESLQVFIPQLSTQHLASTVSVPDGNTVILCGPAKKSCGRVECGVPVLSNIPYLDRCFRNVAYSTELTRCLIMVTPRIIINEEEEQIFLSKIPPIPRKGLKKEIVQTAYPAPQTLPQPMPTGPSRTANLVGELLKAYDEACAAGHAEEAERLARAALALDATCFQKGK